MAAQAAGSRASATASDAASPGERVCTDRPRAEKKSALRSSQPGMVIQSRGALAYTVVDVSARPSEALIESLRSLETSYRVRLLMPQ